MRHVDYDYSPLMAALFGRCCEQVERSIVPAIALPTMIGSADAVEDFEVDATVT